MGEKAVPVLFRMWRRSKDVIALFPTILAEYDRHCRRR